MSAQDKQVKITIAVDEASAAKAKRAIADLVVEVNRLVEATNKVNLGFGGGGGGGGMGMRVGAVGGSSHTSAGTQVGQRVVSVGGGLADNLTRAVQNSASLFRGAAEGSKGAFDVMTKALKRHVDESDREIQKLMRSLKQYEGELTKLQGMGAGPAGMAAAEGRYFGAAQELQKARQRGGGLAGAAFEMEQFGGLGAGAAPDYASYSVTRPGGPGWRQRLAGMFSKGGGGGGGIGGMLGGALGGAGMGFLAGASIPAIIGGTASYLGTASRAFETGNLGYAMDRPMFTGQKEATYGRVFGGQAQSIRGGDLARVHAIRSLANDADLKTMLGDQYKQFMVRKTTLETPEGGVEAFRAGKFGEYFKQRTGRGMARLGFGDVGPEGSTKMEIDREKAMAFLQTSQPEKFQQMIENRMQSDPRYSSMVNNLYSGASGMVGLADASRTSGGFTRDKQGNALTNTTNDFMFRSMKAGWDPSQVSGMMGSLAPTLGWRGSGEGMAQKMLGLTTGGFSAAPIVAAAGQQYGTSSGLLNVFQKAIGGRRGLDISAGSNIGNLVGQTMMGGQFYGGSGQGLASTLLAATGASGDPGMDMRMSRIVGGGLGATERMASGGIDPLQKALNASAALKVAGNAPYATHHALMGMSGATALDIMRTGKVSPLLAGSGVTKDLVSKYVGEQDRTAFARVSDNMLTGDQQKALRKYRSAGGVKGMGDKDLATLAGVLSMGTGDSLDDAYGRLRIQASRGRTASGGTGAHRASSAKSQARAAMKGQGVQSELEGMHQAVTEKTTDAALRNQEDSAQGLDNVGRVARANASNSTSAAVDNIAAALNQFVTILRRDMAGGGRGGPPKNSAQ